MVSELDDVNILVFFLVDVIFNVYLSYAVKDLSFFVMIYVFNVTVVLFKPSKNMFILSIMTVFRFILFSLYFDCSNCFFYWTLMIIFAQKAFSRDLFLGIIFNSRIGCGIFVIFFVLFFELSILDIISDEFLPNRKVIDYEQVMSINKLIRVYVFGYVLVKIYSHKLSNTRKEDELWKEGRSFSLLEDEELYFMKRFSHFTRTNLNGIFNFLYLVKKELISLKRLYNNNIKKSNSNEEEEESEGEIEEEEDVGGKFEGKSSKIMNNEQYKDLKEQLVVVEYSCHEILNQTTDLCEFYLGSRKNPELTEEAIKKTEDLQQQHQQQQNTNVRKVIQLTIEVLKKVRMDHHEKKNKKIIVDTDISPNVPQEIHMNSLQFSKIITNIISNSMKYTENGTIQIDVFCTSSSSSNEDESMILNILVTDTGIGMTKKELDSVFKPFYQDEKKNVESMSLGLYVVKSIIERLGGSIIIDSEGKGCGTKVDIQIPIRSTSEIEEEEKEEKEVVVVEAEKEQEEEDDDDDDIHILIVEDNVFNQKVFSKQVEFYFRKIKKKVQVHITSDGIEGLSVLKKIHQHHPLIITDVDMPVMNGIEFCEHVRRTYSDPVYAITATVVADKSVYMQNYGFVGVESKPVSFSRMGEILQMLMVERRKKKKLQKERKEQMVEDTKKEEEDSDEEYEDLGMFFFLDDVDTFEAAAIDSKFLEIEEEERNFGRQRKFDELKHKLLFVILIFGFFYFYDLYFCYHEDEYKRAASRWWEVMLMFGLVFQFGYFFATSSTTTTYNSGFVSMTSSIVVISYCVYFSSKFLLVSFTSVLYVVSLQTNYSRNSSMLFILIGTISLFLYVERNYGDYYYYFHLNNNHYLIIEKIVCSYFLLYRVIYKNLRYSSYIRESALSQMVDEIRKIQQEINLTLSRTSHDLATPSTGLLLYIQQIGKSFFETIFSNYEVDSNNEENKPIIFSEYDYEDEEEEEQTPQKMSRYEKNIQYFLNNLLLSSIFLETSVLNFLVCCKLRNKMSVQRCHSITSISELIVNVVEMIYPSVNRLVKVEESRFFQVLCLCLEDEEEVDFEFDVINSQLVLTNLLLNALIHGLSNENIVLKYQILEGNNDDSMIMSIMVVNKSPKMIPTVYNSFDEDNKKKWKNGHYNTNEGKGSRSNHPLFSSNSFLGIGLFVCKNLAKHMGGKLEITQIPIRSDLFKIECKFEIPIYRVLEKKHEQQEFQHHQPRKSDSTPSVSSEEVESEDPQHQQHQEHQSTSPSSSLLEPNNCTVLCFDDNPIIVNMLRFLLMRRFGFSKILTTTSWGGGKAIIEEERRLGEKIHLLFIDFHLDKKSTCFDFFQSLDNFEENKPERIIVFTGDNMENVKKRSEEVNIPVDGYLEKPLDQMCIKNEMRKFCILD